MSSESHAFRSRDRPRGRDEGPITILFVENEPRFAEACAEALEHRDERLTVHVSSTVAEAEQTLTTDRIDCIVSNYRLPDVDGIEFLKRVREEFPNLPFILFTGRGSEDVASEAISEGVTEYLQKSTVGEECRKLANRITNSVHHYRLQKERDVFEAAVEHAGHSIYITKVNGVIEYVNSTFEEMTGYSAEVALGVTPRILKSGEHDQVFYEKLWDTILSGEVWESEIVNERKDGERYIVEQTIAPILDENGDPERFVAVNKDVTERKRREDQLREFKHAIDHSGHAVFITERDGTITYVNPAFEKITGYDEEETIGETPRILNAGAQDDDYYSELWETVLSGEIWEEEIVNERKDGSTYYADQTIAPLTTSDGTVEGFVAIQRDVTERKEYEETLEQQRDNLEVLNQLIRHDIRNNLQVITTYAELLDETVDNSSLEYVDRIVECSENAVSLTETARDLAEIVQQPDLEREQIELSHTLRETVQEARAAHETAEITVEGGLPHVTVYATEMLKSVFRNLLNNAVQHNDKATPEITVSVGVEETDVVVRIADNGPGIPDEQKEQIFEQDSQGPDSDGTGLGLYLVCTLVEEFDGTVWVEDGEPDGAIFNVRLPRDVS